ncbi:MAG: hypothetical protein ACRDWV_04320, partial [Acidimicrobiales bacterium]
MALPLTHTRTQASQMPRPVEAADPFTPDPQGTMTMEERAREVAEHAGYLRNLTSLVDGEATTVHHDA